MRIHYLVTSLESGGAEAAIPHIVQVLQGAGHSVEITACEPRDMAAAPLLDAAGLPYHLLAQRRLNKAEMTRRFIAHIKDNRPDVIWTSLSAATLVGQLAGALFRIPVVSWKHSASARTYIRFSRSLSALWIADSYSVERFLLDGMHIPPEQVTTWPLFQRFAAPPSPQRWDGMGPIHIGSVGRLHPVKNYDLLIQAIAALLARRPALKDRVKLTIAGDGPERGRLEALIARHALRGIVHLPGAVRDVQPFLAGLHLYVQPSQYEGMCLAMHEAMSAGLPVIATPVGEMAESLRQSDGGILLTRDIVSSCADAIGTFIDHPRQLSQCGERGQAYIDRTYSEEAFREAGLAIVRRIEGMLGSA